MSCNPKHVTVPLEQDQRSEDERRTAQRAFVEAMASRRTVRDFSTRPVPFDLVEQAIRAASSAPSGAHVQPWRFLVVSDPELKRALRAAAEEEERRFYEGRATPEWLAALAPLGTDWRKPFL